MTTACAPALLERLGARYPLILAPMFGSSGPELIGAVARAGGFPFLAGGALPAASLRAALQAARAAVGPSAPPPGVNIWAAARVQDRGSWSQEQTEATAEAARRQATLLAELRGPSPPEPETPAECESTLRGQVDTLLEEGVQVVSVHFGWLPPAEVKRLLDAGVFLIGNATNVAEARALEQQGACAIIAQGKEAGGHRGTFLDMAGYRENAMLSTANLVREVVSAVSVPVIAAGGLMNGAEVRDALAAGAQAAQMGTAFLTAEESLVHEEHRRCLLGAHSGGASEAMATVVTQAFTGKPARALANRWAAEMSDVERRLPNCFNGLPAGRALAGAAAKEGRAELMTMWAGEGFPRCRALPASELLAAIAEEAGLAEGGQVQRASPL